jgi:uncharacterized membrane protein
LDYLTWKWLHVLSSTLLFGTGIGTAFAMFAAHRAGDVRAIAVVTRNVVRADWLFTATSAVFQPLSGLMLVHLASLPLGTFWIWASFALYAVAIACWLPVVVLQIAMRNMAREALAGGAPLLPGRYWRYERWWIALGIPAFFALLGAFWLMVTKPV